MNSHNLIDEKIGQELSRSFKKTQKTNNYVVSNMLSKKRMGDYITRISTRPIKFCQIKNPIIIAESGNCEIIPDVFIDCIEFTEGSNGCISYHGDPDTRPNLKCDDFSIKIPCLVTSFIVRISVEYDNSTILVHWLVDLKIKSIVAMSIVKDCGNPDCDSIFKNTSAVVFSNPIPNNIFNYNPGECSSNLRNVIDDKDTYVSPYNIYLFTCNK